ncbi:glucose-6-phosphate dehydrogenase [Salinisphaera sp. USBA-960]|nr:glucose-6-phosphate dehydrogenase [Salifodinibacter halophilus]NNC26798.1 glucose-6-phosphate dehydrogenase [Salifodinibacter halophilus]
MPAEFIPVSPFDLVIFGGTGDLAARKLLPALYHRDRDGQLSEDSRIIGVSRRDYSDGEYVQWVADVLAEHLDEPIPDDEVWQRFTGRLGYQSVDVANDTGWSDLAGKLGVEPDGRVRVFYLATAAQLYGSIARTLADQGLATESARIVLEKPVGFDEQSARAINDAVGAVFDESRIFRIDHYLGKEAVQNLLALRFGNSMFEPVWNRNHIDHVQITVAEDIGVEERLDFYEQTGALRDMVQNHLLQLLCLVAMEPPASMHYDDIRNEKMKVLRALRPITTENCADVTVRGRYAAGMIDGEPVDAYGADTEADRELEAETFVAIKAELDSWRWRDTPFYLRTGKRMAQKSSKIVFQFKPVPHSIFGDHSLAPNTLTLTLQPEEGVNLKLMTKDPGPGGFHMTSVPLNLSFSDEFDVRYPDSYERLLMEVLRGNPALFMGREEVESAWQWIDQIGAAWRDSRQHTQSYLAGSWGPPDGFLLIDRDGRRWQDE